MQHEWQQQHICSSYMDDVPEVLERDKEFDGELVSVAVADPVARTIRGTAALARWQQSLQQP